MVETIAADERVVRIDLVIHSRAKSDVATRNYNSKTQSERVEIRIEYCRFDQLIVVDFAALEIQEERGLLLHQWATEIAAILPQLKWRALRGAGCKRIARIKAFVLEIEK